MPIAAKGKDYGRGFLEKEASVDISEVVKTRTFAELISGTEDQVDAIAEEINQRIIDACQFHKIKIAKDETSRLPCREPREAQKVMSFGPSRAAYRPAHQRRKAMFTALVAERSPDNHMRLLAQRLLGKLALLKFMEQASKALGWPPKCRRPLAVPVSSCLAVGLVHRADGQIYVSGYSKFNVSEILHDVMAHLHVGGESSAASIPVAPMCSTVSIGEPIIDSDLEDEPVQEATENDIPDEITFVRSGKGVYHLAKADLRPACETYLCDPIISSESPEGSKFCRREAIGLPAGAVPSRTQLRTPLERSLKTGQLPVHPGTRCLRCGADHPDSVCRDLHEFLQKQKIPKYKRLPDCEASFKVRSISDLDSKTGTFLADFQLELNWVDAGLQRDTHYTEDYQSQTLQLFPAFETHIFSPEVVIENAVEPLGLCPLPGVDSKLQIQAETLHGLWLRRKFHFKGLLECSNTTYANFPLDTHAIPISIRLKEWRGATPKVISPVPEIKEVRGSRKDAQKQEAFPGHKIPKDSVHLGDLGFVAWGVWSRPASAGSFEGQPDEERYELIMVVRRGLKRHVFTFFILSMAVLSGSTSLFCPLSVDMLAGRLSINVTVLLSMVAFSVQRPNAIENVPYNTLHDLFVQVCTLMTATLALCNLATHLVCFEMTDGCAECVREDSWCETGSCGSKVIDCVFFYVLVGVLVSCDVGLLIWARHIHRTEIWGFRALCRDLRPDSRQGLCKGGLSWARCPPFCLPRRLRAFQCCCRKGKLQRPGSKLETSRVIARRRDSVQKACAGRRDPHEGVPCFFLRRRDKFLPLPGGLCELTMQQWKEAVEQSQQKDRASLLPIRRCISRFSRSTMGTSAFSRRLQQPAVLEGPETHYLDLGGGEVGYYRYRQLPDGVPSEQITCIAADKMEWPGLKEVLDHEDEESPRVQSLREQLVSYLVREYASGHVQVPACGDGSNENQWVEMHGAASQRTAPHGDWSVFPHMQNKDSWKERMGSRAQLVDNFLQQRSICVDGCMMCKDHGVGHPGNWSAHIASQRHFKIFGQKICTDEWPAQCATIRRALAFNHADGRIWMFRGGSPPPLNAQARAPVLDNANLNQYYGYAPTAAPSTAGSMYNGQAPGPGSMINGQAPMAGPGTGNGFAPAGNSFAQPAAVSAWPGGTPAADSVKLIDARQL
eukprot:s757_g4.t1